MQNNLVSMITSLYCFEKFISDIINSVLSQTYQHLETIIEKYLEKDS